MLRFIFLLIFLFVHMHAWSDAYAVEPLDFKGVPFGVSEQKFLEIHPEFKCSDAQGPLEIALSDRTCFLFDTEKGTYAGVSADLSVGFYANRMAMVGVYFDSKSFDFVRHALAKKYGKPTAEETETLTTAMGGEFLNEKSRWNHKDGMVIIRKYAGKITRSKVSIYSVAGLAEMEKRKNEAIKQGGNDL